MKNLLLGGALALCALSLNAQDSFRTQTIGGWGSSPEGDNPGAYLHENFEQFMVRDGGITIGYAENTMTFTSAEAITAYLPATGKAVALDQSYIDATKREVRNTFASQVLALSISVGFDYMIEDYSASTIKLGDMAVTEGEMAGLTVKQVLDESNKILGGAESQYSIEAAMYTLTKINEAYVDGEIVDPTFLQVKQQETQNVEETRDPILQQESSQQLFNIESFDLINSTNP